MIHPLLIIPNRTFLNFNNDKAILEIKKHHFSYFHNRVNVANSAQQLNK